MRFLQFENGKVWMFYNQANGGLLRGALVIDGYDGLGDYKHRYETVYEAALGKHHDVRDFSYVCHGEGVVSFHGSYSVQNALPPGVKDLDVNSDELRLALSSQFDLMPMEVEHALDNLGTTYGPESCLQIAGSYREIRTAVYPEECSYVRIVVEGLETAYWCKDEWRDAPSEVMGALLGAASG